MPIAYVEHPVSPDKKEKIRADGYTVIDIKFKPDQIGMDDTVIDNNTEKKTMKSKSKK